MKESYYTKQLSEEAAEFYQNCVDLLEKGKQKQASARLNNFLEEQSDFIPALNKRAVLYIYEKDYAKAQDLLQSILNKDPDYAPALTNLGSIAKELGNTHRAKELYQQAIASDDEYGPAYNNLGVIYREEGDYNNSIKYLKKARKRGSFSYQLNSDKPFYKDPGCLFIIFLLLIFIFIAYLILN